MLKTLLEDRFKLAAHREMRTIPAYALVVGKNGLNRSSTLVGGAPYGNRTVVSCSVLYY